MHLAFLDTAFRRCAQACADVAGATLVVLMLITVTDIVARRVGIASVRGIVEISTMAVVLIAFLALANSFILGGHIVVDLATGHLSERTNRRIDAIWLAVAALCLTLIASSDVALDAETVSRRRNLARSAGAHGDVLAARCNRRLAGADRVPDRPLPQLEHDEGQRGSHGPARAARMKETRSRRMTSHSVILGPVLSHATFSRERIRIQTRNAVL